MFVVTHQIKFMSFFNPFPANTVSSIVFFVLADCDFDFDEDNNEAKAIVAKICALPIGERLWPNYLGRPIRNAGQVNVEDFASGLKKSQLRQELWLPRDLCRDLLQKELGVRNSQSLQPNSHILL